jgi:3-hydroxyisobutyrate dehydrogenase-like beta-hydroxyacid dehydrogenase
MTQIGILHPGAMGISVAASAQEGGHTVCWASAGRSQASQARAQEHNLHDLTRVDALVQTCDVLISVCPPAAAEEVAQEALEEGFHGLYVDANAIAPQRAKRIGARCAEAGVAFVDGGIVGGPAWKPGTTWLYLSGPEATSVAELFAAGPLETEVLGPNVGDASALKMCYAAYTKGTTALLAAILAVADELGVGDALAEQWTRDDPDFAEQAKARTRRVTAKAWRFAGEMEEIVATFADAGLPDGFHRAAADVYTRLAGFKDGPEPSLVDVLAALRIQRNEDLS